MTYDLIARIAQQGGLIFFGLIFLAALVHALWPPNADTFARAARMPLEEDDQ